jgi:hypothetical protein
MSDEMPDSPMTALAEGAAQLHEMYIAYMDAGFSEERAFDLTTTFLMSFLEN